MTQTPPVVPPRSSKPEAGWGEVLGYPLACAGAMVGAGVGAAVVIAAWRAGFYAPVAVGVCAGFGATLIGRRHGVVIGIMAAVIGLVGSLITEWWVYPFVADDSLGYFFAHVGQLTGFDLLMHGAGAVCGFYIGWRR
ncbi:MAG: hypothetical protein ACTHN5_04855 [Phycisphaerae bacterium]